MTVTAKTFAGMGLPLPWPILLAVASTPAGQCCNGRRDGEVARIASDTRVQRQASHQTYRGYFEVLCAKGVE